MTNDSDHSEPRFKPRNKFKRKAQLTTAADVLQGLLQNSKSQLADGFLRWRLELKWPEVVGKTIAEQTLPVAYERGTLFVWVRHSTWMQQLWYFQEPIKEKVNDFLTGNTSAGSSDGNVQDRASSTQWCRQVKFTLSRRAASTAPEDSGD